MAITARDVAHQAGCSVSTVSRALSRPDLVSDETRVRIAAVARQLHYRPNSLARSLSTGKTNHLGLVLPDLENPFFSSVAKGVQSYARSLGYSVFIADTDENTTLEAELVRQLAPQVDGVLLCSPRCDPEQILSLADTSPMILLNRQMDTIPSVSLDHADGVRQAIRHLWALGHRVIAYAGGPRGSWSGQVRRDCFLSVMATDPAMEAIDLGHFQPIHFGGMAAADLALATDATAIIAFNDLIAIGLVQRLADRGVRVPEDISVVGTDDIMQASLMSPALTTVGGGLQQLGRAGVDALLNPDETPLAKLLPVDLIVRASTAEANRLFGEPQRPLDAGSPSVLVTGPN